MYPKSSSTCARMASDSDVSSSLDIRFKGDDDLLCKRSHVVGLAVMCCSSTVQEVTTLIKTSHLAWHCPCQCLRTRSCRQEKMTNKEGRWAPRHEYLCSTVVLYTDDGQRRQGLASLCARTQLNKHITDIRSLNGYGHATHT